MGHDARTGREGIGQFNEGEVLRIVQTGVECQFSESRGNRCDSGGYDTLGFPSSHLSVHDVVIHRFEPEAVGGLRTIQRE